MRETAPSTKGVSAESSFGESLSPCIAPNWKEAMISYTSLISSRERVPNLWANRKPRLCPVRIRSVWAVYRCHGQTSPPNRLETDRAAGCLRDCGHPDRTGARRENVLHQLQSLFVSEPHGCLTPGLTSARTDPLMERLSQTPLVAAHQIIPVMQSSAKTQLCSPARLACAYAPGNALRSPLPFPPPGRATRSSVPFLPRYEL
jgi:hypothetical protein